ncbi:grpb/dephospho-CoA kinase [Aspergillus falconensis]
MAPNPITHHISYNAADVETVSKRPQKRIEIVEPDPAWPAAFAVIERRIKAALPQGSLLYIQHVGSTSVPNLPAKAIIDVDVVVVDPTAEETYAPALENAGFQFLFREPKWYEHRMFGCAEPYANVHVFGPESPELVRHRLFRDWLRDPKHEADRELYANVKRQAADESRNAGETVLEYNDRKEPVIREILRKVYEAHGLLDHPKNI